MSELYAQVAVPLPQRQLDRLFDYRIPEGLLDLVKPGCRVIVPFGGGNKRYESYVVSLTDECGIEAEKIKDVLQVLDEKPLLSSEMLQLARWMRDKYYSTLADCIRCLLPAGIHMKVDEVVRLKGPIDPGLPLKQKEICEYLLASGVNGAALKSELMNSFEDSRASSLAALKKKGAVEIEYLSEMKEMTLKVKTIRMNSESPALQDALDAAQFDNSPRSKALRVLAGHALPSGEGMQASDVLELAGITMSTLKTLEKNGLALIEEIEVRRNSVYRTEAEALPVPDLTQEQESALAAILESMNHPNPKPVLLHGVTGSGKTELYMRVIEETLKKGRQAIVLVPEISLTPQTVNTFLSRFGNQVTVTHSRLSLAERYDQWKKARDGQASVMIGPRSAVFAPFRKLGAIIVDEEHENTYKSETTPKYCAKEVAVERARLSGAAVIFGSATPSVSAYFQAEKGEISLVGMKTRINQTLPEINIVDMRKELADGNRSIFGKDLKEALKENARLGKQSILFLNRRGHSTFVSCRKCGMVLSCDSCSVNYTYHIATDKLICHYCGKTLKKPDICPSCGSKFIKLFGIGTQKVEEETRRLLPSEEIIRMDMDTTSGKNGHADLLHKFRQGRASVLIGTQMIAKGLDFPNVTLVGVMAADISLNNGDFRSGETTFQLLTQVAGRAGRADFPGKVFIQTYTPEHYSIIYAKEQNYEAFYQHEISIRRQMSYPPYTHVFYIMFIGSQEKQLMDALYELSDIMASYNRNGLYEVLGPAPAKVSKIKNKYRWKILIKAVDEEKLKSFSFYCLNKLNARLNLSDIYQNFALDPNVMD
ncbi:MAG: primosomal protein N' [Clostridiales bacterium]|nr:primosomal protein N' [Clostridiales bacterium]